MNFKRLLFALVAFCLTISANAQDKTVTGKVTDSQNGSALPGATVQVKGTKVISQTNTEGLFKINVPAGSTTLVISYSGYANQEAAIGSGNVNVSMSPIATNLNELVVVAYGTRKKGDLTGAVASVQSKDFQKGNIASAEQLLQGKVAGLQVTSGGGSAGGGSRIRIRGGSSLSISNDPLLVIDGVPVEGNGIAGSANLLNSINPNDIESMSVLKDASATALYGSRASNGVLIITTKKGAKGKVRYNFNTQASVGIIGKKIDVLSADQVRSIVNADAAATGNNTYKNLLGTANTDWQDEIFQGAFASDNNISASGSIKNIPFRLSMGFLNQNGILKTDQFNRFSTALNLSPKFFNDALSVNLNAKFSSTNNTFANGGAVGSAIAFDPTKPVMATNKFGGYYEWLQVDNNPIDLSTRNPLGLLNLRDNKSTVNRFIGNIQLDYKLPFFPDLHVLANLGLDNIKGSGNDNIDSLSATNYKTGGRKTYYEQGKVTTLADISLSYSKDIKSINSKIDVLVGHSYQDFLTNIYNFPAFSYRAIADAANPAKKDTIANTTPNFLTDKPRFRLESYFARVNYSLNNKYLLTASIRSDASSKFSQDTRVGYFPAVAAAWKLKEEFFTKSKGINELKLRLGWGITGQQEGLDYYGYLPRYSQSTASAQYQFGSTYYTFLRPAAYDPNIKWETTTTTNIGLDFGFANNRITGSVEFYNKKTKDLISKVDIAPGANFDIALFTNVGNITNNGVEFTLNIVPVKTQNFTWEFGFNVTYNKNEITNLVVNPDPNFKGIEVSDISGGTGNKIGKHFVGLAPYTYNVYKQVYDSKTGMPLEGVYEDINRDGQITNEDRYFYKKPAPDVLLGINTQVSYKDWSFGLAAHGAFGGYLYNNFNSNNGVLRAIKNPINFIGNASSNYLESGFTNNQYLSDYYIENASFLRLDNINIGYNAGKVFNKKASLRIAASVQNVFVITKYKGLDPENSNDTGVDNTIYPRPRIFSLGLNFDF
jgi:TonB-linked SusC/RagA family outer membrane protein